MTCPEQWRSLRRGRAAAVLVAVSFASFVHVAQAHAQCERPSNLNATDASTPCTGTGITITWNAVPSAGGYRVYRNTVNASGTDQGGILIGSTGGTSYVDNTGTPFVTYWYSVRAFGGTCDDDSPVSFTESGSRAAIINAPAPTIPPALQTCAGVTLTWPSIAGNTGFDIGRSTSTSGPTEIVGSVPSFSTTFTDTTGNPGWNYYYYLRAKSVCGTGPFSATPSAFPIPTRGNRSGSPGSYTNPYVPSPDVPLWPDPSPARLCPNATVSIQLPEPALGPPSYTDSGAIFYQWRRNGVPIDPASNPTASMRRLRIDRFGWPPDVNNGVYDCVISNPCGSVVSASVTYRACAADFTCTPSQRVVDANDIFAFLDAWFARARLNGTGPYLADCNQDSAVTADDIFFFLDLWFEQTGNCP